MPPSRHPPPTAPTHMPSPPQPPPPPLPTTTYASNAIHQQSASTATRHCHLNYHHTTATDHHPCQHLHRRINPTASAIYRPRPAARATPLQQHHPRTPPTPSRPTDPVLPHAPRHRNNTTTPAPHRPRPAQPPWPDLVPLLEFMQLEAASANLRRVVVVIVCRWLCTWLGLSEIPQPIETGNHQAGVEKVTSHSFPRSTSKTTTTTNPANAYPVPNTTTTACHSHPNDDYNTAGRGSNNDEDDTPAAATTTTTTHRRQFNHNGNDSKAGSCDRNQRRATT
ncbi:hypothetical protein EDB89DRAFT_1911742 [Lactarius sanguifluus]|nr:hypothetical protein EDB89DRAFT_1911742 [Lactarius sanguifluus]